MDSNPAFQQKTRMLQSLCYAISLVCRRINCLYSTISSSKNTKHCKLLNKSSGSCLTERCHLIESHIPQL